MPVVSSTSRRSVDSNVLHVDTLSIFMSSRATANCDTCCFLQLSPSTYRALRVDSVDSVLVHPLLVQDSVVSMRPSAVLYQTALRVLVVRPSVRLSVRLSRTGSNSKTKDAENQKMA